MTKPLVELAAAARELIDSFGDGDEWRDSDLERLAIARFEAAMALVGAERVELAKYGSHLADCEWSRRGDPNDPTWMAWVQSWTGEGQPCSCGFKAVLADLPPDAAVVTRETLVEALHVTHATCLAPVELCDLNRPVHRQFHEEWAAAILAAVRGQR